MSRRTFGMGGCYASAESDSDSSSSDSDSDTDTVDSEGDSDSSSVDVEDDARARAAAARREDSRRRTVAFAGPMELRGYVQDRAKRTGRPIAECSAVATAERAALRAAYDAAAATHVPHVEKPKRARIRVAHTGGGFMAKKRKTKTSMLLTKCDAAIVETSRDMPGPNVGAAVLREREQNLRAQGRHDDAAAVRAIRKAQVL